ncbi:MAG: hypothetical protein Q9157_000839 [Trypethelium eluteriae]
MVLDDATNNARDNWVDDSSPSADSDSYSSSPSNPLLSTYRIDLDKLPQPFRFTSAASQQRAIGSSLEKSLVRFSKEIRRPLSRDEAAAICELECKSLRTTSYGMPIFTALGAARCYQTAATFRFPLYQPNPAAFQPESFFGIVRGSAARICWHALRAGFYCSVGGLAGTFFIVAPYAASVASATFIVDPRLRQFNKDILQARKDKRDEIIRMTGAQKTAAPQQDQAQYPSMGGGGTRRDQDDDMSPTASDYSFSGDGYSATDTGTMSDSQSRANEEQRSYQSQSFDSPSSDSSTSNNSTAGGSAWDRIRAQAASNNPPSGSQREATWSKVRGNGNKATRDNRTTSDSSDSFSFSNAEEDRALAKSEAQKEFDARIERERRGKNF